jgi:hypothetical protein
MSYFNPFKTLNVPKGAIKRGKPIIKYGRNPDGEKETDIKKGYSWSCAKCGFEHASREVVCLHYAKNHGDKK